MRMLSAERSFAALSARNGDAVFAGNAGKAVASGHSDGSGCCFRSRCCRIDRRGGRITNSRERVLSEPRLRTCRERVGIVVRSRCRSL